MALTEQLTSATDTAPLTATKLPAPELLGDQDEQEAVLEGLAEAVNHRRWFSALANPYLGSHPIEIGSGFGDYAEEWLPHVERFTCTEAEPARLTSLKERFAEDPRVDVREMLLPTDESADHTSLVTYNVLEHIESDVEALRSMGRLVRPGAPIVVVVPAFPFAMSHIDIATGHVRRYTKRTMRHTMEAAGLIPERIQYVNALGLIGYYAATSVFKLTPKKGNMVLWYDRWVAPVTKALEKVARPPFGQSVLAIARTPE
jgi:ubiquinone/menaquinone biosynthesis C-methylase UbiE